MSSGRNFLEGTSNNDTALVTSLIRRFARPVYRFHLFHTGNSQDAQELTRSTFQKALGHGNYLENESHWISEFFSKSDDEFARFLRRNKGIVNLEASSKIIETEQEIEASSQVRLSWEQLFQAMQSIKRDAFEVLILLLFCDVQLDDVCLLLKEDSPKIKQLLYEALHEIYLNIKGIEASGKLIPGFTNPEIIYDFLFNQDNPPEKLPYEEIILAGDLINLSSQVRFDPAFFDNLDNFWINEHQSAEQGRFIRDLRKFPRKMIYSGIGVVLILFTIFVYSQIEDSQVKGPLGQTPTSIRATSDLSSETGQAPSLATDQKQILQVNPGPDSYSKELAKIGFQPMNTEFLNTKFSFSGKFPTSPKSLPVSQVQNDIPASLEQISAVNEDLSLNGQIYSQIAPRTLKKYWIYSGAKSLIANGSISDLTYLDESLLEANTVPAMTDGIKEKILSVFINAGLLVHPEFGESPYSTSNVSLSIEQLIEGIPVFHGEDLLPMLQISVTQDGKLQKFQYRKFTVLGQGNTPTLPAELAWKYVSGHANQNIIFYRLDGKYPDPKTWVRTYQTTNEDIHLYGYPQILSPNLINNPGIVLLNGIRLEGNPGDFRTQVDSNQMLHVWGSFRTSQEGNSKLDLQGWEIWPLPRETIQGDIIRQGAEATLQTDNGDQFYLSDLPVDLLDGSRVIVSGVLTDVVRKSFGWDQIKTISIPPGHMVKDQKNNAISIKDIQLVLVSPIDENQANLSDNTLLPIWKMTGQTEDRLNITILMPASIK